MNFFAVLASNESLKFLTRLNKEKKEVFWDVFIGKNLAKHRYLLNTCIIVWGQSLVLRGYAKVDVKSLPLGERAKAEFQPNSIHTYHKQLFSSFRFRGITYLQRHFKYYEGSYHFYWRKRFAATLLHRPRYGILEKRAA